MFRIEVEALKLRAKNLEERIEILEEEKRDARGAHQTLENELLSTKVCFMMRSRTRTAFLLALSEQTYRGQCSCQRFGRDTWLSKRQIQLS